MELLIRVKDKVGSDIYKNVQCTKRGHVIVVMPDGHDWAARELDNPEWRIIRITGISDTEAGAMLAAEPGDEKNRMLQRRAFKFDLSHVALPAGAKAFLADDSRKNPIGVVSLAIIRQLKTQLQPVKDPDTLP